VDSITSVWNQLIQKLTEAKQAVDKMQTELNVSEKRAAELAQCMLVGEKISLWKDHAEFFIMLDTVSKALKEETTKREQKKPELLKLQMTWGPVLPSSLLTSINSISATIDAVILTKPMKDLNLVTSFAGCGSSGFANGNQTQSMLNSPQGIALDEKGNIFVADAKNHRIRMVTQQGVLYTVSGGSKGFKDGSSDEAMFNEPQDLVVDLNENIFVADRFNHAIRKITPQGVVSTIAGTGKKGYADGPSDTAMFAEPCGIAVDVDGNVFVSERKGNRIRKITQRGIVTTLAGNENWLAQFHFPMGIAIDKDRNLYVADQGSHKIKKVTPEGEVSTVAGSGGSGVVDGPSDLAEFSEPQGITINQGNLYVTDRWCGRIRKITQNGMVTTVAGSGYFAGCVDGECTQAKFNAPSGIAVDVDGNLFYRLEYCVGKICEAQDRNRRMWTLKKEKILKLRNIYFLQSTLTLQCVIP